MICRAQTLGGSVVAADTGSPLAAAVVVAFEKRASSAQRPAVYKAFTDGGGRFTMPVAGGQYQLCVHEAGMYLDPCRWGGASVVSSGTTNISLRLAKGGWFVVRVHDNQQVLPSLETSGGYAVSAVVLGPSGSQFLLPKLADDGRFRDYGAIVPLSVQMNVRLISDSRVAVTDENGVAFSAQGATFTATPSPAGATPAAAHGPMFHEPDATVFHAYIRRP
jgi:hypothetical protein